MSIEIAKGAGAILGSACLLAAGGAYLFGHWVTPLPPMWNTGGAVYTAMAIALGPPLMMVGVLKTLNAWEEYQNIQPPSDVGHDNL